MCSHMKISPWRVYIPTDILSYRPKTTLCPQMNICHFDTALKNHRFKFETGLHAFFIRKYDLLYLSLKGQFGQNNFEFSPTKFPWSDWSKRYFSLRILGFFRFCSSKKQCFSQAVYVNISTGNNWQSYPFKVKLSKIKKVK